MRSDFGKFLVHIRSQRGISAKWLSDTLGISQVYMCDIEKGRRRISDELLPRLAELLLLTENECCEMYDLAALSKNTVSSDIADYIMQNDIVRKALRAAKKQEISDDLWHEFIRLISVQGDKK